METLKKNDTIELKISGFTSEGSGVGHYNGQAVFVNGAAAGDTVKCVIIKAKKSYCIGKLTDIIKASPDRIIPDCPAFPRCGGCSYRHISYEAERKIKRQKLADALQRLGGINIEPEDFSCAAAPERYRNKAQYPLGISNGRLMAGFYAPFSHRVIDCKNCLLQPESFAAVLKATARWCEKYNIPVYNEETNSGLLRHIYIRKGFATNQTMVCLVINGDRIFKAKELVSALTAADNSVTTVLLNHNSEKTNVILGKKCTLLYGSGYIEDILCGLRFRISPLSFYQVNPAQAEKLYEKAAELAITDDTKTLIDLYCGAGTIGLSMARRVERLYGVEIVPQAIEDAKINMKLNGIENAEFICADAAAAALSLKERGVRPDSVIIDPPRKGCDAALIETIVSMNPQRVVYVSCDPATLARDCKTFESLGYTLQKAIPFDLFPRTVHVETVCLLSRNK